MWSRESCAVRSNESHCCHTPQPSHCVCQDWQRVCACWAMLKDGMKSKTVVIKLGSSSILSESTLEPKIRIMSSIVEAVSQLRQNGHRVVLVCSGAIGLGRIRMNITTKPKNLGERQALAALGQLRLMTLWDNLFGMLGINLSLIHI